jgi:hypothetical protein
MRPGKPRAPGGRPLRTGRTRTPHARYAAATLVISLLAYPAAGDEQTWPVASPIPWQDPAPPDRLFLQQPFEAPEVIGPSVLELSARLLYANIILVGSGPGRESYTFDEETGTLLLGFRHGLGDRFEVGALLPVVLQYGGFLDSPIEFGERLLGLQNATRLERPRDMTVFQITGPDGRTVERLVPGVGLGDLALEAKGQLLVQDGAWPAVALSVAMKLPSGGPTYGSGETDFGGSLLVGWTMGRVALRFAVDIDVPTVSTAVVGIPTRVYGAIQSGAAIELGRGVALQVQAAAHRPPLDLPGLWRNTYYVLVGVTAALSRNLSLEAGVAENLFSPARGSDITFLFGVRGNL